MPSILERIKRSYSRGGLVHLSKLVLSHLSRKFNRHRRLFYYNLKAPHKLAYTKHDVMSLSEWETLQYLESNDVGIVRYGDGELAYLLGGSTSHDPQYPPLRKEIYQILASYDNDVANDEYLTTLPLEVTIKNNYIAHDAKQSTWSYDKKYAMVPFLKKGVPYGSQFCFREDQIDHNETEYREKLYDILSKKDIIYVTDKNRFSDRVDISKMIYIPPESEIDAFHIYEDIKERSIKASENYSNPLILISAGVTATALSAELNSAGYLSYDIGKLYKML